MHPILVSGIKANIDPIHGGLPTYIASRFPPRCLAYILYCDGSDSDVSKKYLNKIYLKKLKFLLLTGEIVENVY